MCLVLGLEAVATVNDSSLCLLNPSDALGLILSALCELFIDSSRHTGKSKGVVTVITIIPIFVNEETDVFCPRSVRIQRRWCEWREELLKAGVWFSGRALG